MTVEMKKIGELKPYGNNPRDMDGAVEYVANSIKEFGWKVPIVVDKDGVIVAGHTRYKAAQQLGVEEIPCVIADDLTPEQIKAFRIADNKTAEMSRWNYLKLVNEIECEELKLCDYGFTEQELGGLVSLAQDFTWMYQARDEHAGKADAAYTPRIATGRVSGDDIAKAQAEQMAFGGAATNMQYKANTVICPHCGEEFELSE